MIIKYKNSYLRDIKKITNPALKEKIEQIIKLVKEAQTLDDIPELRKLKGYKKGIYYRIKVGHYRIGVTIVGDLVSFSSFGPRKEFYRYYPPR